MPAGGQGSVHFGHRTESFWVRGNYHRRDYCFLGSGKEVGFPRPRGGSPALSLSLSQVQSGCEAAAPRQGLGESLGCCHISHWWLLIQKGEGWAHICELLAQGAWEKGLGAGINILDIRSG